MLDSPRVADFIVHHLESIGVEKVFLLSGGGMMHLLDAISRSTKLSYVCHHHEQAAAMAAEAYAKQSSKLGVCFVTSGPGATNALTGVVGAWTDSSPVLFISGQSKLSQTIRHSGLSALRQFGTFEVDILPLVQSITKYSAFIDSSELIKFHLEKAIYLAQSGRPGPVWLDIPLDVQGSPVHETSLEGFLPTPSALVENPLIEDDIRHIFEKLGQAKRPLILAGHGIRVSNSTKEFHELIQKLQVPVVTTSMAMDLLPYDHPLFIGHPGVKGDRAGNLAVQTCDVLLVLGSSLHVLTTGYELKRFAPQAYKIQIDPDEAVLQRQEVGVQKQVCSNLPLVISSLLRGAAIKSSPSAWHERCRLWKNELSVRNEKREPGEGVDYYDLLESLSELLNSNDTVIADAGLAFYVTGHAFRAKAGQRVIISGGLGTMGYTLPALSGVCAADSTRRAVGLTGDGSLQTNLHELAVLKLHGANAKLFVQNNGGYASIRNTQAAYFQGRTAGTDAQTGVAFPSLEKLALAYELPYFAIRQTSELYSTARIALETTGPVVIEVFCRKDQEIAPTVSSVRLPNGQMQSRPLEDMAPFLEEARLRAYLEGI